MLHKRYDDYPARPDRVAGGRLKRWIGAFTGWAAEPRLAGVLRRIDLREPAGQPTGEADLHRLLPRAGLDVSTATEQVRPTVEAVRARGAAAVIEAAARLHGGTLRQPRGAAGAPGLAA